MNTREPRRASTLRSGPGRAVIALIAAAALSPVAGLGVRLVASGLPPFPVDGDHALIEIATRQAAAGERLLGPYSRFGFHHPGPALFYVFAPFFAVSGGSYLAVCLAVVVLNLVALAATLAVLARSKLGEGLAWPSLVLGSYALFLGPSVLASPWNPHATLLPLLATLVAAAAVMAGRDLWLPAAVAGASLVLESHLGLLPVLAAVTAVVLLARVPIRPARSGTPRTAVSRAAWSTAAVVAVVAWLPVGLEAALHRGGNLASIATFLRHRHGGQPFADAVRTVLAHIGAPVMTPWGASVRDSPGGAAPWLGLAVVLATVLALAVAARRRRRLGVALAVTELVSVASAVVATASVVGPLHEYLVRWVTVLAPLALLAIGEALRPEAGRPRSVPLFMLGLALAATAVAGWRAALTWDDVERLQSSERFAVNRTLADAALAEASRTNLDEITLIPVESERWSTTAAVAAKLLAAGKRVAVGSRWDAMFGLPRSPRPQDLRLGLASSGDELPGTVVASCGDESLVRLEARPLPAAGMDFGRAAAAAYLLDGFDAAEGSPPEGFRWMIGRTGRVLLPVADPGTSAVLAIEMAPLAVRGMTQEVTVRVDGSSTATTSLGVNGFQWYRFAMPYRSAPGIAGVELVAAWARSPFELDAGLDVRLLSVRIRRLRLEPAAPAPRAPQPPPG